MSKVHASSQALREFSKAIKSFIAEEERLLSALSSAYSSAGSEWQDSQYHRFGECIDGVIRSIQAALPQCEATIHHLENKADRLDEYNS